MAPHVLNTSYVNTPWTLNHDPMFSTSVAQSLTYSQCGWCVFVCLVITLLTADALHGRYVFYVVEIVPYFLYIILASTISIVRALIYVYINVVITSLLFKLPNNHSFCENLHNCIYPTPVCRACISPRQDFLNVLK